VPKWVWMLGVVNLIISNFEKLFPTHVPINECFSKICPKKKENIMTKYSFIIFIFCIFAKFCQNKIACTIETLCLSHNYKILIFKSHFLENE
jgi:uncharacterized membrane protein required for colicin V production